MKTSRSAAVLVLSGLLSVCPGGCSVDDRPREDETTIELRHISRAYETIKSAYRRSPRDLEEIKQVLADLHAAELNDKPEEVLVSSRDGQPYVIVLGVDLGGQNSKDIFLYEKAGKDGVRYVMNESREVLKLTDAEFAAATFSAGHMPQSN